MPFPKIGDNTPKPVPRRPKSTKPAQPAQPARPARPGPEPEQLDAMKEQFMFGDLDDLNLPDGVADIILKLRESMMVHMNSALDELIEQGRLALIEERLLGRNGDEWDKFRVLVSNHFDLDVATQKVVHLFACRVVFLLIAAIEQLGREVELDPHNTEFPEIADLRDLYGADGTDLDQDDDDN